MARERETSSALLFGGGVSFGCGHGKLVEDHAYRLLNPPINDPFDFVVTPRQPGRESELQPAPLRLRFNSLCGSLPQQREFVLADAAFDAEKQPVVCLREVPDLMKIGNTLLYGTMRSKKT
jgi:hypothetical protein